MRLDELALKPDERMFLCGRTGCGKTTLIRRLLAAHPNERQFVIDTKPEWDVRKWFQPWDKRPLLLPSRYDLKRLENGLYVMQPEYPHYNDAGVEKLFVDLLKRKDWKERPVTVVIDELGDFARGGYVVPHVGKLFKQGRAKNIRVYAGAQEPKNIPGLAVSQANKLAVFRLKKPEDRQAMAKYHAAFGEQPGPGKHDFWLMDDEMEAPRLIHQSA